MTVDKVTPFQTALTIAASGVDTVVRVLTGDDRDAIEQLVSTYEFHEYRHLRIFQAARMRAYILDQVLRALTPHSGRVWGLWQGTTLMGLIHVAPASWEADHFGVRMFEIQHLIVSPGTPQQRQAIAQALLAASPLNLKGPADCLVHRIDPDDYPVIHALEACGFRLVNTLLSFVFLRRTIGSMKAAARVRYQVRPMAREDADAISVIARQTDFKGRFYNDPHFTRQQVDEMYLLWVRRCCDGTLADEVIVAEHHGRVVGFITYRRLLELERVTGMTVAGCGLLSVMPKHTGAGVALFQAASLKGGPEAECGQFDIRLTNPSMLRLCGAFGMRLAHTCQVFHCWPGDTPRAS